MAESALFGNGLITLIMKLADDAETDLVVLREVHSELVVG